MNDWKSYRAELAGYKERPKFERLLQVAAIITELLEKEDIRPIIVGGLSVEIYTLNHYSTHDLDLVVSDRKRAGDVLENLGFERVGKDWIHKDLGLSVEIPDEVLAGDTDRVTRVPVEHRHVYVIGVEDIIIDRLRAAVHWRSREDREWGYRLFLIYDDLNLDYINEQLTDSSERKEWQHWIKQKEKDIPLTDT